MISKNELLELLKKYNISPNKKLGQNFLFDKNVLEKIADASNINKTDTVIEIGPGPGLLTGLLSKRAKHLFAIEKDEKIFQVLKDTSKDLDNIEIINQDIFDFDYQKISKIQNLKIVSNLPYNIASLIILDLLKKECDFESMTFLIQKELAERLTAKKATKEYGSLTMITDFLAKKEVLFDVSKNVFIPVPKVTSSLIKIATKKITAEEKKIMPVLEKFLSFAFSMRRKKIKTAVNIFFKDKNKVEKTFELLNIDSNKRIEELDVSQIYEFIVKL